MPVRLTIRPAMIAVLAAAGLSAGVVTMLHADQDTSPAPSSPLPLPSLEDRVTKLERLANQPTLPPDPTVAAHAATTQPDSAANLNAPADVKQAFIQMDTRIDTLDRRLTVISQQSKASANNDDQAREIADLQRTIDDQRRDIKALEGRVHHLEQHN